MAETASSSAPAPVPPPAPEAAASSAAGETAVPPAGNGAAAGAAPTAAPTSGDAGAAPPAARPAEGPTAGPTAGATAGATARPTAVVVHSWTEKPAGEETSLDGIPAYYAAPPPGGAGAAGAAQPVVILVHGTFGWKSSDLRRLADRLAATSGCHVYLPDLFGGEMLLSEQEIKELFGDQPTFMGEVKQDCRLACLIPAFLKFVKKHDMRATQPLLDKAVDALKMQHGAAFKLGAAGYGWGGRLALRLGAQGKAAAVVAAYPNRLNVKEDALKDSKAPVLFIRAQTDYAFTGSVFKKAEAAIKAGGAVVESAQFPRTRHGFAVRCKELDAVSLKARDDALRKAAAWFAQYLA